MRTKRPRVWPITLEIPEGRLDDVIRLLSYDDIVEAMLNLPDGDKVAFLESMLQGRINRMLVEPSAVELCQVRDRMLAIHRNRPPALEEAP